MIKISRIVFVTGSRSDYGKMKSLICETEKHFETYIYVCGMHVLKNYGNTSENVVNDDFKNIYCDYSCSEEDLSNMDIQLSRYITGFSKFINKINPDMIIVHGDRIEAFAGAIAGMLNNKIIAHIEGGEITGSVDESIRHSISKLSHVHFVSNNTAQIRLLQLGEDYKNIFVIGSPDIEIMLKNHYNISYIKKKNNISFDRYAILLYHPVVTEIESLEKNIQNVIQAVLKSNYNYIFIYPNNDYGSEIIINEIEKNRLNDRVKIAKSFIFEEFLTILRHAMFIIGNSSAGIREAGVYKVPCIDIGTRQSGRYNYKDSRNIQHARENIDEILECIAKVNSYRCYSNCFGRDNTAQLFIESLKMINLESVQKRFIDSNETKYLIGKMNNNLDNNYAYNKDSIIS